MWVLWNGLSRNEWELCNWEERGIYWLCAGHTEQVSVFLMATESRRSRGGTNRGVAFCLARTSAIAAASHVTLKFFWLAPNQERSFLLKCFKSFRLLGLLETQVLFSGHLHSGDHFQWVVLQIEAKGKKSCFHSFLLKRREVQVLWPLVMSPTCLFRTQTEMRTSTYCKWAFPGYPWAF